MKTRRIRILDSVGLAILITVLVVGLLWTAGSTVIQRRHLQQENDLMARQSAGLKRAEGNLQGLRKALNGAQNEGAHLYRKIPQDIEMGALVKKLHTRMRERRIRLAILQPLAVVSEDLYRKVPIRLVFQGGFAQIYRFFHDLETMDQLLVPEIVILSGSGSSPGSCMVDLTLLAIERKRSGTGG